MERKPKAECRLLTAASAQCEKHWEDGILAIIAQLPVGLSSHSDGHRRRKGERAKGLESWPGRALYYFHHASIANTSRSKLKLTWGSRVSDWLQGPWGCDVRLHVASPKIHSGLARSFHPAPAPLEGEIAHAGGTGESFYAFLSGPLSTPDGSPQASLSVTAQP